MHCLHTKRMWGATSVSCVVGTFVSSIPSGRISPVVAKLTCLPKGQGHPRPKPNRMHDIKSWRTMWMIRQTGQNTKEMPQKGALKNQDRVRHRLQLGVWACVGEYTAISWKTLHAS
ncbi:hypothetical protein HanRHA438_Chr11g0491271 [Helianthus annuus]|nr:hypothetical protein HanRHA438_Chr11g0491271 [Helianthus annuus]